MKKKISVNVVITYETTDNRKPSLSEDLEANIALSLAINPNYNTIEEGVSLISVEVNKEDDRLLSFRKALSLEPKQAETLLIEIYDSISYYKQEKDTKREEQLSQIAQKLEERKYIAGNGKVTVDLSGSDWHEIREALEDSYIYYLGEEDKRAESVKTLLDTIKEQQGKEEQAIEINL